MSEEDKSKIPVEAPAKQQSKCNRNPNARSKSPVPGGQEGQNNGGKSKSPQRPKKTESIETAKEGKHEAKKATPSLADLAKKTSSAKAKKAPDASGVEGQEKADKQKAALEKLEKDKQAREKLIQKQKELAEQKEKKAAEEAKKAAAPDPVLLVDGLLLSMYGDYLACNRSASMEVVLAANATSKGLHSTAVPEVEASNTSNALRSHLTAAFFCDPALTCIVSEAKSTQFVSITRGRQQAESNDNKSKGPKKSPGPRGKNGKFKSPGPDAKNGDRSQSPGPRGKKGKSKSPVRQKKSASAPAPAKKAEPAPTNGNKKAANETVQTTSTEKLPLHVQFDPFLLGMVGATSKGPPNTEQTLIVLSTTLPSAKKWATKAVSTDTSMLLPPSYLEVEPLMSQMIPEEIAEAINLELSRKWEEEEMMEENEVEEENETMVTPTKPQNDNSMREELPGTPYMTPPKDFKGRVAFFEKLTKQKPETPRLAPTVKVKAEVSEKVRSAHDQVRTSLGGGVKASKNVSAELPKDMTPIAQKRERVDRFFEKAEETVPSLQAPAKAKQNTNWAKVETAPPETEKGATEEAKEEPEQRVDEVVSALEKSAPNGKASNNGRSKSPKRNKERSKSPRRNNGKSKSPARPKKTTPEDADAQAPVEAKPLAPAVDPTPAAANETTPAPSPVVEEKAAATPATPAPAKEKVPVEKKETTKPEEATKPEPAEQKTAPKEEEAALSPAEKDAPVEGKKAAPKKGRSKSPRRKKCKSKSPARPKKTDSNAQAEQSAEPAPAPKPAPVVDKAPVAEAVEEKPASAEPARKPIEKDAKKDAEPAKPDPAEKADPEPVDAVKDTKTEGEEMVGLMLPSESLKTNTLTDSNGLESAVSTEEVHGELLSRDIATEVLEDAEDVDDKAPQSAAGTLPVDEEFPSLTNAPRSPKRSAESKKSYAQILAEGKKREQERSENAKYPEYLDFIPQLTFEEKISFTGKDAGSGPDKENKNVAEDADAKTDGADKPDDAERVKMEEMAQRLAEGTPQKKLDKKDEESGAAEESQMDDNVAPGFTPIKREPRKKKVPAEEEGQASPRPSAEQGSQSKETAETNVVPTKEAFRKDNFNQFRALADDLGDIPTEIATDETKKGKVRALKTAMQSKKKKPVRFGGTKIKEPKGAKHKVEDEDDFIPEPEPSPPLVAMPLHLLNNLAHTKPLCYILDGVFWFIALCVGAPLGVVGIVLLTIYKLLVFFPRLLGLGIIKPKKTPGKKLAVVITGCDHGFGKDLAFALLNEGFVVFCGCLRKESLKAYEEEELAMPILMDVTKDGDVDKASKQVMDWLSGDDDRMLHALVNNSGIGTPGLVDWTPVSEMQKMVDVNFMGMVRCTKKFLPHFKFQAGEGTYSSARIVNIVSVAGLVSGGLFTVGYEASKHASEVFTTNLRLEMKGFGLKVTVINPSFHKTKLTQDMSGEVRKKWKSLPPATRKEYGGDEYINLATKGSDYAKEVVNWDSQNVVDAMVKSVVWKNPPAGFLVGGDAKYMLMVFRMLPTWISSRILSLTKRKVTRTVKKSKQDY